MAVLRRLDAEGLDGVRAGMKPHHALSVYGWVLTLGLTALGGALGCAGGGELRSQSPEEIEAAGASTKLVADVAVPFQMNPITIESIGLVGGLERTGDDPGPSPQRVHLVDEMRTRGISDPSSLLASQNFSMVYVRAFLRPGIQKGDRFDVELRVPQGSETTSLRGGVLLESRMKELAVLQGEIREGDVKGIAKGPLLVDPPTGGDDDRLTQTQARILGGGIATFSRPLALVVKPDVKTPRSSSDVSGAINKRFNIFAGGEKVGVAKPINDEYIEIVVHPRYKDNIDRYMRVLRAIAVKESATGKLARLVLLERQLLDPVTSAAAALRLEAIGRDGVKPLLQGIASDDAEVRFYAAEALAYLDEGAAAGPLAESARNQPAFRVFALAALSAMDDVAAYDALQELLNSPSAETRYGAFRSLWAMNPNDSLVRGEQMETGFSYHVLPSADAPMIHVTRSFRPEVVLFGADQRLEAPFALDAGNRIMVNSHSTGDDVVISRFAPGQPDQKRVVSNRVDEIIRTVVELGGSYPDIVQMLQQAKKAHALASRFEIDALPEAGRVYRRDDPQLAEGPTVSPDSGSKIDSPLPDLFSRKTARAAESSTPVEGDETTPEEVKKPGRVRSFFARMRGN